MPRKEEVSTAKRTWRILEPGDAEEEGSRRQFANDVLHGLFRAPKAIPSRYFYDEEGNRLFQKIMDLPEYYLTDCELEILETQRERIAGHIGNKAFNLVELGAGDGTKTRILLRHFCERGMDFRFVPIDICRPALLQLVECCGRELPGMPVDGDLVLVGFDLKKDIEVMMRAYNDPRGVTADFNLNLLRRINRELGGDFNLDRFQHYSTYDVLSGAMESYLVSRERQSISIDAIQTQFSFQAWEPIHTEVSNKYLPDGISSMAGETGFEVVDEMYDLRRYFADSLWRVRKP